jgi:hypothetical protein
VEKWNVGKVPFRHADFDIIMQAHCSVRLTFLFGRREAWQEPIWSRWTLVA